MRGLVPALLVFPVLLAALPAEPVEAADSYLMLGIDALLSKERSAADRFLSAALELDPASGDALYYLARAAVDTDVERSISLLRRAVAGARFARVTAGAARIDLASLLVRVGRHQDALRALDTLSPAESGRVEPFRLAAAAHLGSGNREAALSAVEAGLRRYPTDAELHVLRARALRSEGVPVKDVLDLAAMVVPGDARIAAERALAALAEGGLRVEDYSVPSGQEDPRVFAEAFAASPDQALLARFFSAGGNQRVDLLARVAAAAAGDPDLQKGYDAQVAAYSGRRWVDENNDSIAEEIYQYEGGALVSWIRDANQDLAPEIRYERGTLLADGVRYEYDPYPYLAHVTFERGGTTWTFDLPPRRIQGAFVEGLGSAGPARLRLLGNLPREGTLAMSAIAVSAQAPGGPRGTWVLEAGVPAGYREDADGDGKPDYVLTYRAGRPATGQRDVDHDGIFDVTERWSAQGLSVLEVDLDHNGVPDYRVDFDRRVWLWDYNQDGVPDRSAAAPDRGPPPSFVWPAIVPRRG